MRITVYFEKPLGILGDVYDKVSSDHALIVEIDSNDAGMSFETEDKYYIVPMHQISHVVVEK